MNAHTDGIAVKEKVGITMPKAADVTENQHFVTQVFSYQLPEQEAAALNAQLLKVIYAERTEVRPLDTLPVAVAFGVDYLEQLRV